MTKSSPAGGRRCGLWRCAAAGFRECAWARQRDDSAGLSARRRRW